MKIYTKTGDDGTTGLIGGDRVRKSDRRIECYGTVDELNAVLGWVTVAADGELISALRQVQNDLFVIGSHLASPDEGNYHASLPALEDLMVHRLEMQIDSAEADLVSLREFILPGGTELASRLHVARTVCRRTERLLVDFAMDRPVAAVILTYINRLSDWLFVQARAANQRAGLGGCAVDETPRKSAVMEIGPPVLRYAVLSHTEIAEPHFDLLVETRPGSDLATWRSPAWPIEFPTMLTRVKDHRRLYLDYEGEVSDWRGRVLRVDEGTCQVEIGEDQAWTITMQNRPAPLILRHMNDDQWEAGA